MELTIESSEFPNKNINTEIEITCESLKNNTINYKAEQIFEKLINTKCDEILQIVFNRIYLTDKMNSHIRWRSRGDILGWVYHNKKRVMVVCSNRTTKGKIFVRKNNNEIEEYNI